MSQLAPPPFDFSFDGLYLNLARVEARWDCMLCPACQNIFGALKLITEWSHWSITQCVRKMYLGMEGCLADNCSNVLQARTRAPSGEAHSDPL
jgi:hypothetical protein